MTAAPLSPLVAKLCPGCGASKPLDEYHVCRKAHDGRAAWCKSCYQNYHQATYQERKASHAADRAASKQAGNARRALLTMQEGKP